MHALVQVVALQLDLQECACVHAIRLQRCHGPGVCRGRGQLSFFPGGSRRHVGVHGGGGDTARGRHGGVRPRLQGGLGWRMMQRRCTAHRHAAAHSDSVCTMCAWAQKGRQALQALPRPSQAQQHQGLPGAPCRLTQPHKGRTCPCADRPLPLCSACHVGSVDCAELSARNLMGMRTCNWQTCSRVG